MTLNEALAQMNACLDLRGLSDKTRLAYTRTAKEFIGFAKVEPEELTETHVRDYVLDLIERGLKPATVNCYHAAVRFLMDRVIQPDPKELTPRMKVHQNIPEMLSRDELWFLIKSCPNLKHRAFFALAYGSGLRVSEICALRVQDIDSKQRRIFVHDGKGGKDRYTVLSSRCLRVLRDYYRAFRPDPEGLLFPGARKNCMMSTQTPENALAKWLKKLGLKKVKFHSLRHAFATQLLENGVGIHVIQRLLGHTSIRTTLRYLHIANLESGILSPLDYKG